MQARRPYKSLWPVPFGAGAAEGVQCEVAARVVLSYGPEAVTPDVCDLVAPDDAEWLLAGDILFAEDDGAVGQNGEP